MPADARERLAGLMLDALDFGAKTDGKGGKRDTTHKPKWTEDQREQLKSGRAQGMTEAGKRVAEDLKNLVKEILHEQRGDNPRSVNDILAAWRGKANNVQGGQKASIAKYATFMRQGERSDYESRVLSLYKALDGPYSDDAVTRETVKRERTKRDEVDVNVLINMYKRAVALLEDIDKKVGDVETRIQNGGRGKTKLDDLLAAQALLENKVTEMFADEPAAG